MGDNTTATTTTRAAAATATPSSRLGLRSNNNVVVGGGEIVEVQGGHIVRSTGRKDRHSKVCTAKGPRDRRVRLSAHTAIQFYDVQDRLGYDRPSKAVDWLIKKAKAAIDELDELPAWNPVSSAGQVAGANAPTTVSAAGSLSGDGGLNLQSQMMEQHQNNNNNNNTNSNNNSSGFLPPSLDSDAIADTIKSFFPVASEDNPPVSSSPSSSMIQFQSYPPDLLSRTSTGQSQDLQLSLQSFQDPILLHHHHQQEAQAQQAHHHNEQVFFSGFGWSDHHHQHHPAEINRFQRIVFNNNGRNDGGGGGGNGVDGGFVFNSPPLFTRGGVENNKHHNNNQFFSFQRGPLQSSNTPSVRAWIDHHTSSSPSASSIVADHQIPHSLSGMGFIVGGAGIGVGGVGGFSGFDHSIPARIQGEEEHDGISDKPSSASSDSRH